MTCELLSGGVGFKFASTQFAAYVISQSSHKRRRRMPRWSASAKWRRAGVRRDAKRRRGRGPEAWRMATSVSLERPPCRSWQKLEGSRLLSLRPRACPPVRGGTASAAGAAGMPNPRRPTKPSHVGTPSVMAERQMAEEGRGSRRNAPAVLPPAAERRLG
jgi:hypothetical protein